MKAQIGPIGTFANGAAERKIVAEITTAPRASRRSLRPAGRVARNGRRSSLDRDSRYRPFGIVSFTPGSSLRDNAALMPHHGRVVNHMVGSHGGRPQLPLRRIFDTEDSAGYQVTMRKMERIGSLKAEICLNRVGTLWPARSALLSDPIDLLHFSPPARTPWDAPISVLERAENPAQRLEARDENSSCNVRLSGTV
jgi:hypothetical protein